MSKWHKDPDWILDNWTDDYLDLMVRTHNASVKSEDEEPPSVDFEDMKKAQLERFEVWKEMNKKKA
jgi:hypothetical protein